MSNLEIRFSGSGNEFVNLTDFWKKSGKSRDWKPSEWVRNDEAQRFINYISRIKMVAAHHLFETRRGRNGGTYAHWQIALAYAKYLSPEMHSQANEIIRQYVTADPELTKDLISRTDNTEDLREFKQRSEERIRSIESTKTLNQAVGQRVKLDKFGYPLYKIHDRFNQLATGRDTKTIREERGIGRGKMTRDAYSTEELNQIAFAQNVAAKALDKFNPKDSKSVVDLTNQIADDCESIVQRYT